MEQVAGLYSYWVVVILMMAGLYIMIARYNLVKKIIGLGVFQTSIFYLYITMGKVEGGTAPIIIHGKEQVFSNPVPHVLILTAIVVGVATSAVALALIVRIYEEYGTIEEDEIQSLEAQEPEA